MSDTHTPRHWIDRFARAELPVLARTVVDLQRMRDDAENVKTHQLSEAVMHDPVMTFKVLRYIQQRRRGRQQVDVTTIAHALMMLGMNPFFDHFAEQVTLESRLASEPKALQGALAVIRRARHAALYARDWAVLRHDIEVEEVTTAALLHDFAELLLWCCAPETAMLVQDLQRAQNLRSEVAQREVLGFPLIALQLELAHEWQLPELLCTLMDERHASTPRALNVSLAVALARHSANGWDDPALPDDFASIARLLGTGMSVARERVMQIASRASADAGWYDAGAPEDPAPEVSGADRSQPPTVPAEEQ